MLDFSSINPGDIRGAGFDISKNVEEAKKSLESFHDNVSFFMFIPKFQFRIFKNRKLRTAPSTLWIILSQARDSFMHN